jgi:glucose-1-phosphate cytidylyltransferase
VKSVILAGGLGTRLREETEFKPKPMVQIGDKPIIWHIMRYLSSYDLKDFVLALGYKGEQIKNYFEDYQLHSGDIEIDIIRSGNETIKSANKLVNWSVELRDTGLETMTGGRIFNLRDTLKETFLCTYGDGLADVNIASLIEFHKSHGKLATVTAAIPKSRFGALTIEKSDNSVTSFQEKPKNPDYVSAGFFIFEPQILEYLSKDSILEKEPLENLVANSQLMAYKHDGFWQPMDTLRENQELNELWENGDAPWKIWQN